MIHYIFADLDFSCQVMTGRAGYDRRDRDDFIRKSASKLVLTYYVLLNAFVHLYQGHDKHISKPRKDVPHLKT